MHKNYICLLPSKSQAALLNTSINRVRQNRNLRLRDDKRGHFGRFFGNKSGRQNIYTPTDKGINCYRVLAETVLLGRVLRAAVAEEGNADKITAQSIRDVLIKRRDQTPQQASTHT